MTDSDNTVTTSPSSATAVGHVGICVRDLERSTRFYSEAFGFEVRNELAVPDAATTGLLDIVEPVGLTARYLTLHRFVLELLWFDRDHNAPSRERPFTEPGLTHLSITVDDLASAVAAVARAGGSVLDERTIPGVVAMVRDPDGQTIELLSARHAAS